LNAVESRKISCLGWVSDPNSSVVKPVTILSELSQLPFSMCEGVSVIIIIFIIHQQLVDPFDLIAEVVSSEIYLGPLIRAACRFLMMLGGSATEINCTGKLCICISLFKSRSQTEDKIRKAYA
jgi:hypothetical protein